MTTILGTVDTETEKVLVELASSVAALVRSALPDGVAFAVVLSDQGDAGSMVYASNVARPEMIALLAELRQKMIEGSQ